MTTQILPSTAQELWFLEGLIEQRDRVQHIPINSVPFRIGRSAELGLCLPSPAVSKAHAEIVSVGDKLFLRDLNSTNGTFVNGHRVEGTTPIGEGDLIQFATIDFRVKRQAAQSYGSTVQDAASDLKGMLARFHNLMSNRAVVPVFQPIIDFSDERVIGYEMLSRSRVDGLETPRDMFLVAERLNLAAELSTMLRWEAARIGNRLAESTNLFVNTHPTEKLNDGLLNNLREIRERYPRRRFTIEIHEGAVTDLDEMRSFRDALSELDIHLAYDDFGAGQARLLDLVEVPPDYLKFDIKLVRDIHRNPQQQQMVKSLVNVVRDFGIAALAEGVECAEEADTCRELGFDLAQGYFFGRPLLIDSIPVE